MVESKGQGAEDVSCSFEPMDEDYKEGFVILFFGNRQMKKIL